MSGRTRTKKFLCDEHLLRLGRWLRAAGYDTAISEGGRSDRVLIRQAVRERRLLVTRDRKCLEFRDAPGRVIVLRSNTVEGCVIELTGSVGVNWLYRPFTRCLICNGPLVQAGPRQRQRVPDRSRSAIRDVQVCRHCRKLYWEGSHVDRMRKQLMHWNARSRV